MCGSQFKISSYNKRQSSTVINIQLPLGRFVEYKARKIGPGPGFAENSQPIKKHGHVSILVTLEFLRRYDWYELQSIYEKLKDYLGQKLKADVHSRLMNQEKEKYNN